MKQAVEKLRDLLEDVSDGTKSFMKMCSDTRIAAAIDPSTAFKEYVKLASSALSGGTISGDEDTCIQYLRMAEETLSAEQIDAHAYAIKRLREEHLRAVVQPAIRDYVQGNRTDRDGVQRVYEEQLRWRALEDLAQFMNRIRRM
ncbi:MAG: hypothetical protein QXS20_10195 [Candidatus Thorarchaeota archaeon]